MSADPSLARGAVGITVATAVSRVTGFVRVIVVAGAMGTTFLANVYQTSNTVPNVIFELLAAGVLTSVFVPTFVDYLVRGEREEGWAAANALTSVALVGLVAISLLVALAAPVVMKLLTAGVSNDALREREVELGARFLRLFAPQIVFYGAGMIMTGALHAQRRFALAAAAPIFNNVVVIGVYLTYAAMRGDARPSVSGISDGEVLVLGLGTTFGVIAMTLCLVPQLRRLGWKARFRWEPKHPAVRKGARLGAWALGYAGGYQAGLIVVMLLANKVQGGVAAYQWAFTFFYLPHALFGVPIFNVLFTAMAEHASRGEEGDFHERLRDGLSVLVFLLVPIAAFLVAASQPLARLTLEYGVMTQAGAAKVGRVLEAFALGLPTYSAFLVFTRAFYALGETRLPTIYNAVSVAAASGIGALFFFTFPTSSRIEGLALAHSVGFGLGTLLLARAFKARFGSAGGTRVTASIVRALAVGALSLAFMTVAELALPESSKGALLLNLVGTAAVGAGVYLLVMWRMRSAELQRMTALLRRAR